MSPSTFTLRAVARTVVLGVAATTTLGVGSGAALAAPAAKTVHLAAKVAPTGHPRAGGSASLNVGATLPKGDSLKRYVISYGDKSKPVTVKLSKKVRFPKTVKHTYGRAGRYTVTLTLTDAHNHTSKVTTDALILAAVTAGGAATSGTTTAPGKTAPAPTPTPVKTYPTLGWGANTSGQLGDGSMTNRTSPVTIGLQKITSISSGVATTYAIAGGVVYAWGDNSFDQLGTNTALNTCGCSSTPARVMGLNGVFTQVAAAGNAAFALRIDGTVWAWGSNLDGELGTGTTTTTGCRCSGTPVQVAVQNVKALAAGAATGYALKTDGTVWGWGQDNDDQLGNGASLPEPPLAVGVPVVTTLVIHAPFAKPNVIPVLPTTKTTVTQIGAGAETGYALRSDGTVWAWGQDLAGEVGIGYHGGLSTDGGVCPAKPATSTTTAIPDGMCQVKYPDSATSFVTDAAAIAAGGGSAYLVNKSGYVYAWGDNTSAQLGRAADALGSNTTDWNPSLAFPSPVGSVTAGAATVYLTSDGAIHALGKGSSGQLGNGSTTPSSASDTTLVTGVWNPPAIASGSTSSSAFAITTVP